MPDHWQTTTLGGVAEVRMGQQLSPSRRSGARPRPYLRAANIGASGIDLADVNLMDFSAEEEERYALLLRDILLVEGGNEKSVGCPALVSESEEGLCFQNTLIRCRIRDFGITVPEFLYFALLQSFVNGEFARLAQGTTILHLGQRRAEPFQIHLPPLAEQRRIADLVGSVGSYIDSLQTQVGATRAARSAVLSDLLSSPGDDWQETTLGELADYHNGFPFKPEHLTGSTLPVIRIRQLLDDAEVPDHTDIGVAEKHRIDDGDIVFSWSATLAVRIWNRGPAALNQHLFKVVAKPQVEPNWLALALDDAISDLAGKAHGTTMKHITKRALSAHAISLPPRNEQRRIVDVVGSIDAQIASLESQSNLAQSFRSGVLSELLSGERLLDESYDVAVSP